MRSDFVAMSSEEITDAASNFQTRHKPADYNPNPVFNRFHSTFVRSDPIVRCEFPCSLIHNNFVVCD
jgi:hypothetical protein